MKSDDLKVKILGIVGTPIKDGNCQYILEEALKAAKETAPVETELVHLQDYRIEYCIGCEGCLRRVHRLQKEVGFEVIPVPVKGYNCGIKDDMEILHKKMLEADGIILAAPVYIGTVPGQVKTFIDRCRTFVHDYRLRGKVAAPLTVAFYRNAGEDTTLQVMTLSLLAIGLSVSAIGASTVSTRDGAGALIRETVIVHQVTKQGNKGPSSSCRKSLIRHPVFLKNQRNWIPAQQTAGMTNCYADALLR